MSSTVRAGSYRDVFLLPSALRTFAPALAGRLAYGLLPLSALFTVQQRTGSFAIAGAATAGFGLASLSMPYKSRLVDRYSQRRVLPGLALVCAAGLILLTAIPTTNAAALVALTTGSGVFAPPLGPSMRASWRRLTEGTELKERAYALDAICEESLYLLGPLLAGFLISLWSAPVALTATAALLAVGTFLMVTSPVTRHTEEPARSRHPLGPLTLPALRRILLVILVTASGISVAYLCLAGVAAGQGHPGATGFLEAGIGLGSVVGGLLWARRQHTRSSWTHLAGLIGVLAAGLLAASTTTNLVLLGVVMAAAGVAVAPLFVVSYLAADELTPPDQRTEASTWINTANNLGSSAGASLAGLAIDRSGPALGFVAGGVLLALTSLTLALGRRRA
ncbi:putative MFS family arabinose efflux permease [Kribbella amoyensis]|uniref:Putative MFS family arabinose efflux permease n=1 Tax=Kribbella amoyensis TaxID=996641 RepID=A0A561BTT4_9ACTN|nr:MFS transporter [Kribbella amoyensis]TWD82285.1 putative MFS family arabinose efflux permease [Kribbella amoyensis]